jgi:hypothetical protein
VRKPSLVALANSHVRIEQACRWTGMDVPDVDVGGSIKVWCPFGELYHPDGGAEAAMRVYPASNHAWCFACSEYFTPVRLCAVTWHQTYQEVALELLDRVGYKPASYAEHWQAAAAPAPELGRGEAAQALRVWAAGLPEWDRLQYDPAVAEYLGRCLDLLEVVQSAGELSTWLEGSKRVMERVCERQAGEHGELV